jgi:hypothetical protein
MSIGEPGGSLFVGETKYATTRSVPIAVCLTLALIIRCSIAHCLEYHEKFAYECWSSYSNKEDPHSVEGRRRTNNGNFVH